MDKLTTSDGAARLSVHEAPPFAWSFEETDAFSFELMNPGLAALADPAQVARLRYTANVYHAGKFVRRVAAAPLPGPVPVGEKRIFAAHLGVTMIGGEYELRFGLEQDGPDGKALALPVVAPAAPLRVKNQIMEAFVELINACNFRCTFCPQPGLKREQQPMDFALATKVVRDLADMGHHHPIRVHLLGEPLLYKRFFDFVEMAHALDQKVFLLTNGSRFKEKTIEEIFRTGLDQLLISLNTPDEASYNEQRGTSLPFAKYVAGIRRMIEEVVRRGGPPQVTINVLYDSSRHEDPEEIARVNRIVTEWVNAVREFQGKAPQSADEVNYMDRKVKKEDGTPDTWSVFHLHDGLEILFTPYHSWGEGVSRGDHFCAFPWRQLVILVDGQATVCCVDAEGEINVGNALTQSIEEIWNGPEVTRIREAFWNDLEAAEPRCARCPSRHWDVEQLYRNHPMTPA